jgi:hypothetical protein
MEKFHSYGCTALHKLHLEKAQKHKKIERENCKRSFNGFHVDSMRDGTFFKKYFHSLKAFDERECSDGYSEFVLCLREHTSIYTKAY